MSEIVEAAQGAVGKVAEVIEPTAQEAKQRLTTAQRKAQEAVAKSDGRFSRAIVVSAVLAVTAFTGAYFVLEALNILYGANVQLPTEVTVGWFTFWTFEIVMLTTIKRSKIKNRFEYTEGEWKSEKPASSQAQG